MELLTGKNKEQFEKWFRLNFHWTIEDAGYGTYYNALPFEMQIGVLLAYHNSIEYYVELRMLESANDWMFRISGNDIMSPLYAVVEFDSENTFESNIEAYKESFIFLNDLVNNNLQNQNK